MTPADHPAFWHLMTAMADLYDHTLSELQLELYTAALEDCSLAQIQTALVQLVRTSRFFPRPAEIRALIAPTTCPRCPGGHGPHAGHTVAHYPAGPWCQTCQADLPVPAGYVATPPPPDAPPQLPARTDVLSVTEVRALVTELVTTFEGRLPAAWRAVGQAPDAAPLTPQRLAAREQHRAQLRLQADELQARGW